MIYGTIIPFIITFVFGSVVVIFSYIDVTLMKNV